MKSSEHWSIVAASARHWQELARRKKANENEPSTTPRKKSSTHSITEDMVSVRFLWFYSFIHLCVRPSINSSIPSFCLFPFISFDRSIIHPFILFHSFDRSFDNSFIFTHLLIHWFVHSFTRSFVHSFFYSFIHLFVLSFIHLLVSFVRSFVCSFIIYSSISKSDEDLLSIWTNSNMRWIQVMSVSLVCSYITRVLCISITKIYRRISTPTHSHNRVANDQ